MSAPFRLRQFSLQHHRSAQRIGTDSMILGAWAQHPAPQQILDIGSGCGLLTFMLAQRYPQAQVAGVELQAASHQEALENRKTNPAFQDLQFYHSAFQEFSAGGQMWDLLVSNPPFFDHPSPRQEEHQPERHQARHQSSLSLEEIFAQAQSLLRPEGRLQLILPSDQHQKLASSLLSPGWQLQHYRPVLPKAGKPAHRVLSSWVFQSEAQKAFQEKPLPIRDQQGNFSVDYRQLTQDFHPWI